MTPDDLKLAAAVAKHLSGKRILVRERLPGTIGLHGETSKRADGVIVIDVSPEVPEALRLHVLLHETAHAKLHNFVASRHESARPSSVTNTKLTRGDYLREESADKQADTWERYAVAHAHPFLNKIAPFEAHLLALLSYGG